MSTRTGPAAWTQGIDDLLNLAERRMRRTVPLAIKSFYRQFMDLEPVWTSMLVFNYNFYVGSAPAGTISGDTGLVPSKGVNRSAAIAAALQEHLNSIPELLSSEDSTYFIANRMDYAMRIEEQGSPRGFGKDALKDAANRWTTHVKLGLAEAHGLEQI